MAPSNYGRHETAYYCVHTLATRRKWGFICTCIHTYTYTHILSKVCSARFRVLQQTCVAQNGTKRYFTANTKRQKTAFYSEHTLVVRSTWVFSWVSSRVCVHMIPRYQLNLHAYMHTYIYTHMHAIMYMHENHKKREHAYFFLLTHIKCMYRYSNN